MGAEIGGVAVEPGLKPVRTHHDGNPLAKRDGKKSVLIQNDPGVAGEAKGFPGRYAFVPEDIAVEMVKEHKAVYVTPQNPDYLDAVKMALGRPDGFKPGEAIQIGGKVFGAEAIGVFDADAALAAAKEAVAALAAGNSDEIATAMLKDPASFGGKHQVHPFGR